MDGIGGEITARPRRPCGGRPTWAIGFACVASFLTCLAPAKPLHGDTTSREPAWAPIHWESVREDQYWISGARPSSEIGNRSPWVALAPGQETTLELPPYEMCHLVSLSHSNGAAQPRLWLSRDGRMRYAISPVRSPDRQGWLVNPASRDRLWLTVQQPDEATCEGRYALQVSHTISAPDPPTVVCHADCPSLDLAGCNPGTPPAITRFEWLPSQHPYPLGDMGCGLVRLQLRVVFPATEQDRSLRLPLLVCRDGIPWQTVSLLSTVDPHHYVTIPPTARAIGQVKEIWLALPQDKARYTLNTAVDLLLRMEHAGPDGYLGGTGGQGDHLHAWTRLAAIDTLPAPGTGPRSFEAQIRNILLNPCGGIRASELQYLADEHGHSDSGITAAHLARQWVALAPHRQARHSWDHYIHNRRTRFLPLMPRTLEPQQRVRQAFFVTESLPDDSDVPTDTFLASSMLENAASGLWATGWFTHCNASAPLVYAIPELRVGSQLQLTVALAADESVSRFEIQIDDRRPSYMVVNPECSRRRPRDPTALVALAALDQRQHQPGAGTFGGPFFSARGQSGLGLRTATAEIDLPPGSRTVTIRNLSDTEPAVSLRCRVSSNITPAESEFHTALTWCGRNESLWTRYVASESLPAASDVEVPLAGAWSAIRRRLRSESVRGPDVDRAVLAASLRGADAESFLTGLDKHLRSLDNAGEHYLTEQYLLALSHSQVTAIRAAAEEQLWQRQAGENNTAARLATARYFAWHAPTVAHRRRLSEALADSGDYLEAFALACDLPEAERPWPVVARCSDALGWPAFLHDAVQHLDPESQALWRGWQAARAGDTHRALQEWRDAGELGQRWIERTVAAERIQRDFNSPDPQVRGVAIRAWARWQQSDLGPRQWKEAATDVAASQTAIVCYEPTQQCDATWVTTPTAPIRFRVEGPGRFRVLIRPLIDRAEVQTTNDWLQVVHNGSALIAPIAASGFNPNITLPTHADHRCGREYAHILELEAGPHELQVNLEQQSALATLERAVPEWRLPHLPLVTAEAKDRIASGTWCNGRYLPEATRSRHWLMRSGTSSELEGIALIDDRQPWPTGTTGAAIPPEPSTATLNIDRDDGPFDHDSESKSERREGNSGALTDPMYQALAQAVHQLERQPVQEPSLVAWTTAHLQASRSEEAISQLSRRLERSIDWSLVSDVATSGGLLRRPTSGWQPDHPALRARSQFLAAPRAGSHVLTESNEVTVKLGDHQESRWDLSAHRLAIPFLNRGTFQLCWRIDAGQPERVTLPPHQSTFERSLVVSGGAEEISVWLETEETNQYCDVKFERHAEAPHHGNPSNIDSSDTREDRYYHLATAQEPITLFVAQATCLRIDEYLDEAVVRSEYRYVDRNETVRILPAESHSQSAYRIFSAVPQLRAPREIRATPIVLLEWAPRWWSTSISTAMQGNAERIPAPTPESVSENPFVAADDRDPATPEQATNDHDAPTGSIALVGWQPISAPIQTLWPGTLMPESTQLGVLRYVQRQPLEEGQGLTFQDKFWEFDLGSRKWEQAQQRFHAIDFAVRGRNEASPSFVGSYAWDYVPDELPYRLNWQVDGFLQPFVRQGTNSEDQAEWSVRTQGGLSWRREVSETLAHTPEINLMGRWLSRDGNDVAVIGLDQDIFTRYKSDHPAALTFGDTWVYQPWNDTAAWLRWWLTTNQELDPTRPDHTALRLGVRRFYADLDWDISYRWAYFLSDDDRARALHQHLLYVDTNLNTWDTPAHRIELGFSLKQNLAGSGTSFQVMISGIRHGRRLFRDYAPDAARFRSLRSWQSSLAPN